MKVGTDSVLLGAWAEIYPEESILDIGTGTGLLSLMLAQKVLGKCTVDAVEIDEGAIKDSKTNFKNSDWGNSITLHECDFNNFNSDILYDVIISNPPFFEGLAPEITSRSMARNASDKLSYKHLLEKAENLLQNEGRFYLILPKEYFEKVVKIGVNNNLKVTSLVNIKPKLGKPTNRVLLELIKNLDTSPQHVLNQEELIIRNEENEYSDEHKAFTKDYYLHL